MKKIIFLLLNLAFIANSYGQGAKDANTKMDEFASKTGVIIKYEDYKLQDIKLSYGVAEAKIRKLTSGGETKYFYQISNEGKYGTKTASIAYEDLTEMQKALVPLKSQAINDASTSSDYTENKFVTDDGFQVGYYVSKEKVNWYITLEKYGNGNTIFVKDAETIEEAFNLAKQRIDELKLK
jgi:hypothetical protein